MKIDEYSYILDEFGVVRHKCKCCGKDIMYDNTNIHITKTHNIQINGKSFQTVKTVNNVKYKLMVCQQCLLEKFPNIKNLSRIFNVMCDATQFAFDIPQEISQTAKRKYALSEETFIKKYGEVEGRKRWESYLKKQAETNTYEYKHKIFNMTEDEFKQYNLSRAVTLNNLIRKYGEEEGRKRWELYLEKQRITKSREYMVDKYGEINTDKINKSKSINLENLIRKYGEEEGKKRWYEYINNRSKPYSKISQECFRKIDDIIGYKYFSMFYSKNTEKCVIIDNRMNFLDYYIPELNICIEFNGDMWHGNPNIYKDSDYCNPFYPNLTAKDLREKDYIRYKKLEELYNIHTYVIWEGEYKSKSFDIKTFLKSFINF